MSRLLFAAARGARIQHLYYKHRDEDSNWEATRSFEIGSNIHDYRIHPDDEHLQYGPISTALRIFGMGGDDPYTLSSLLALNAYMYEKTCHFGNELANRLFLLILAEALADEGL
jgi:hypothetical protein